MGENLTEHPAWGRSNANGTRCLACAAEHAAAVAQATEADNPDEALEIVGLSLDSVVERLSASDGEPAFTFVPPASSTAFIDAYLENSGGTAHSVGGGA